MIVYCTNFVGIGGQIRITPEDFEVSEVITEKSLKSITNESGYAVYKLKKKTLLKQRNI